GDRIAEVWFDDVTLFRRHEDVVASHFRVDAQTLEDQTGHAEVPWHGVFDGDLAVRHRGRRDERADLHVVVQKGVLDAAEPFDPVDNDLVRPDAEDLRAHLHQYHPELLDVRLAR